MQVETKTPFLLENFFSRSELPQLFQKYENINCHDPIVNLVNLFEDLPKQKDLYTQYPHVFFKNVESVYIDEDVEIDPFVFIEGPVWIGRGSKIKHGAYVRPYTFVDHHAVIGHASEVKNSILCSYAKAAHFNYVGDSLLGPSVNLGAGVKCANIKLNKSAIKLRSQGLVLPTRLKKLGAIIGKESFIGCNAVLSPGTLINPYTKIAPNTHVSGHM